MDLDAVADELYEVPPEEFVGVRTARQHEAKAAGEKELAQAIGALPKPSTAAWVCNLLVRGHRSEIQGLVELGDLLRDAQENLAGDELKALDRQRAQLLTALTRQAAALARGRGHAVSSAIAGQVEETLRAAMADPQAGEALLSGRLTAPMSYSGGLGTGGRRPDLRVVRAAEPAPATAPPTTPARSRGDAAQRRREREEERRRALEEQRQRELAEARRALESAEDAVEEARAAAEEERRAAAAADDRHLRTRARVADLSDQLARAEEEAAEADAALRRAERRRRTADREAADAEATRTAARARLEELEQPGRPSGGRPGRAP